MDGSINIYTLTCKYTHTCTCTCMYMYVRIQSTIVHVQHRIKCTSQDMSITLFLWCKHTPSIITMILHNIIYDFGWNTGSHALQRLHKQYNANRNYTTDWKQQVISYYVAEYTYIYWLCWNSSKESTRLFFIHSVSRKMSKTRVRVQCFKIQCHYCKRTFTIHGEGLTKGPGYFRCEEYVHVHVC
jgi:hypothetical protein